MFDNAELIAERGVDGLSFLSLMASKSSVFKSNRTQPFVRVQHFRLGRRLHPRVANLYFYSLQIYKQDEQRAHPIVKLLMYIYSRLQNGSIKHNLSLESRWKGLE
jgi:hypothetical protein